MKIRKGTLPERNEPYNKGRQSSTDGCTFVYNRKKLCNKLDEKLLKQTESTANKLHEAVLHLITHHDLPCHTVFTLKVCNNHPQEYNETNMEALNEHLETNKNCFAKPVNFKKEGTELIKGIELVEVDYPPVSNDTVIYQQMLEDYKESQNQESEQLHPKVPAIKINGREPVKYF